MKRIAILAIVIGLGFVHHRRAYAQPVSGPVAPPRAYAPTGGNYPGWVNINTQNAGPESPLRPNLGAPAWVSYWGDLMGPPCCTYYPPSQCQVITNPPKWCFYESPGAFDGGTRQLPDNYPKRQGYGYAMLYSWDGRWASGFYPGGGNAWANEIPLRTPTPGLPQTGPAFATAHLNVSGMNTKAGTNGNTANAQLAFMVIDFYARVSFWCGPNFTGTVYRWGYNCPDGAQKCHGDSAAERADTTRQYTDINVPLYLTDPNSCPDPSLEVRYGF